MMLKVQEFLRGGGTINNLAQKPFAISAKAHRDYPNLLLLKYDQIDSDFSSEIVRECRGLILDSNNGWNVVNMSFYKFFNYQEPNAASIDFKTAKVYEKLDGSLIQLFSYDGQWMMATSGSPDGGGGVGDYGFTFNELFWRTFTHKLPPIDCGKCFFFELTSLFNKIVVVHKEPSVTLLGGRDLTTMKELTVEEAHIYFPECKVAKQFPLASFNDIIKSFDTFSGMDMEGYVVCDGKFDRVKSKSPQYVALHHLKDSVGSSRRALVEVVRAGEVDEVSISLPEFKDILFEARDKFNALVSELEADYAKISDIQSQKDFALLACKSRCSGALFSYRAKKVPSIRTYLKDIQIDSVMKMLGYKTTGE